MLNMASNKDINIAVDSFDTLFKNISDNFDEVRGCFLTLSVHSPRTLLMSSSNCDKDYATRIKKVSNRMDKDNPVVSSDSVQLKYTTPRSQNGQVSKAADNTKITCHQHISNKDLALNQPSVNNMVNIELNYNINQALDLESWNSNFCMVSLHSSMEYLASDVKNIKESLSRMHKYILSKSINNNKANDIKDLEGIGKVAWEFLSTIYKAY